MATAEGIYPKVGADPLYYTDVNIMGMGWMLGSLPINKPYPSGTAQNTVGSISIAQNKIYTPDSIGVFEWNAINGVGGAKLSVQLSGTSFGDTGIMFMGSVQTTAQRGRFYIDLSITQPNPTYNAEQAQIDNAFVTPLFYANSTGNFTAGSPFSAIIYSNSTGAGSIRLFKFYWKPFT